MHFLKFQHSTICFQYMIQIFIEVSDAQEMAIFLVCMHVQYMFKFDHDLCEQITLTFSNFCELIDLTRIIIGTLY